jgi:penicillin amidase
VALVAGAALVTVTVRAPLPQRDGEVVVTGLEADVEVVRDAQGVPHVYADTAEDLFRAQGYVHAQDRFFEMDLRRHITAGRLSELVGADEAALQADVVVRTLGWRRTAEAELPLLDAASRGYLEAYAEGVNAYVADRDPGELSLAYTVLGLQLPEAEIEPWTPVDSLAWLKALAWDLRSNYSDELGRGLLLARGETPARVAQLYPAYPDANPVIAPDELLGREPGVSGRPAPPPVDPAAAQALADTLGALASGGALTGVATEGLGSNSWVVAGEHTETGAPLLANDPHLAPASPSTWHQVGLHCREVSERCPFDVAGFSFSGMPGIFIGRTPEVAWGLTTLYADHTDFVLERVDGEQYELDGRTLPLEVREEVIEVAGGDPVTIEVRATGNGPLLSDAVDPLVSIGQGFPVPSGSPPRGAGYAVALRWTATEPGRTMDAVFAMNRARSGDDVVAAARLLDVPGQNIVFAESGADGSIGYVVPSRVPVRGQGDGRVPVPGWDSAYEWTGYVPAEQLPLVVDPERGWIVTANNRVTETGSGPYLGTDTDFGYRAARLEEQLGELVARGGVTADELAGLQRDDVNPLAATLVPYLLAVDDLDDFTLDGVDLLRGWDGSQPVDSAPAAYFNAVWVELLAETFHDELPEELHPNGGSRWFAVVEQLLRSPDDPWWDDVTTVNVVESRDEILQRSLVQARLRLTRQVAKDPGRWAWGEVHTLTPEHTPLGGEAVPGIVRRLFNLPEQQLAGGTSIVDATSWDAASGTFEVTAVPSMRMVVDLSEPEDPADVGGSRWVDLGGVSEHPFDDYRGNQLETWASGQHHPWAFTREAVEQVAGERLLMRPSG